MPTLCRRNESGEGTLMESLDATPLSAPPPAGDGLVPLQRPADMPLRPLG
jgi:hypothetical protein